MGSWAQAQVAAPVGGLILYAGDIDDSQAVGAIPSVGLARLGWFACDGRTLTTNLYPELFAAIGYRYGGSGDQFCLPDYRGNTPLTAAVGGGPAVLIKFTDQVVRVAAEPSF